MRAMVLHRVGAPLEAADRPVPDPSPGQVLVKVSACGVCRTDLHLVDGELPDIAPPIVPGHEVVGRVVAVGEAVDGFGQGDRVGIPWLGSTCGVCWYCRHDLENLCDTPGFTGYTIDGGYADYAVADARYCFKLPGAYGDVEAAPLLCAGLIGHRSLKAAGEGEHLGLYGFGAAAHIVAQVARWQGRQVYAFTRSGDTVAQEFARRLGACWAGPSEAPPPHIPPFPYDIMWGERVVRSVANLTRRDAVEFLELAPTVPVRTHVVRFPLDHANAALNRLRTGDLSGAAVLTM